MTSTAAENPEFHVELSRFAFVGKKDIGGGWARLIGNVFLFSLLPPVERFVGPDRMKIVILLAVNRETGESEMCVSDWGVSSVDSTRKSL